jgi:ESCRT-II complex subunit VPS36
MLRDKLMGRNNKVPTHQDLIIHLTTHRLLLLQALSEPTSSKKGLQTNMSYIRQTEFYVGFMRSSPKITLTLGHLDSDSTTNTTQQEEEQVQVEWSCPVCGHSNPVTSGSGGNPKGDDKCGLCGVSYGKSSTMGPNGRATPISRPSTPATPPPPPSGPVESGTTCPACTFLNHPSIRNCEICDTTLPVSRPPVRKQSVPALQPPSAVEGKGDTIRLSFRKGGSNECYRRLKNVLSDKAWESRVIAVSNGNERKGAGIGRSGISFNTDTGIGKRLTNQMGSCNR